MKYYTLYLVFKWGKMGYNPNSWEIYRKQAWCLPCLRRTISWQIRAKRYAYHTSGFKFGDMWCLFNKLFLREGLLLMKRRETFREAWLIISKFQLAKLRQNSISLVLLFNIYMLGGRSGRVTKLWLWANQIFRDRILVEVIVARLTRIGYPVEYHSFLENS